MKSLVFLQSGFWEKLSENPSREEIRCMLDVTDALDGSVVISDLSEEMIQQDKFLMVLFKQKTYKRCETSYIYKQIESLNTENNVDNLCATYLLDNNVSECKEIEEKYGVLVLNASNIHNRRYIFKGDGFSLNKRNRYSLRYMSFKNKLSHPCNSLIIIDPYLLIERDIDNESGMTNYPGIENNLESLLDAILPLHLSIDFHLTIISCLSDPMDINKVYEKIGISLKRIRKDLTTHLNLVYTSKGYSYSIESFHSRHIISNTFAVDSEDGFNLFNRKGYLTKNNPSVSIVFPRMFGDSRQDMTKYFNWISSVKKYIDESSDKVVYGDKNNRLFDLVK